MGQRGRFLGRIGLAVACTGLVAAACDDDDESPQSDVAGAQEQQATPTPSPSPTADADAEGTQAGAPTLADPALQVETIEGLTMPTQIAFIGENDLLVTEKSGAVQRVTDGEVVGPVVELATNYADERGVLGITTHPDFEENAYVYIYWTWTGQGEVPDGLFGPASEDIELVPELGNRVDRFTWDGERLNFDQNIIELASRTTDLTLDRRRGNHNAGVIKFGPDDKLYVVMGDQNARGQLQNVPGGPGVEGPGDLLGVVLRLNDDGSTPDDNPFVDEGEHLAKVWIYGIRNSFGYDFDPESGGFWLETNGQAAYDEIGRYEAAVNVGWIQMMGPLERFEDFKEIEVATDRQFDNPSFPPSMLADSAEEAQERMFMLPGALYREPVFSWRHAVAPTAVEFIEGDALGADYEGDMLVGDVNTGSLYHFELNGGRDGFDLPEDLSDGVNDNSPDDLIGELAAELFGEGFVVATDIKTAPDGTLWVTSAGSNALYHITRSE
jgi:glucose/arabinose dehydrogenase